MNLIIQKMLETEVAPSKTFTIKNSRNSLKKLKTFKKKEKKSSLTSMIKNL